MLSRDIPYQHLMFCQLAFFVMHLFNAYLFTIYSGQGAVLNTEDITTTSISFVLLDLIVWRGR